MNKDNLTEQQRTAAMDESPEILVSASAGSGKTTVMLERVCRLLRGGASLSKMVICTFTNAASADMRTKLTTKLIAPAQAGEAWAIAAQRELPFAEITTIDSFCARICRNYFYYTDLDPLFEVLDPTEAGAYLARAMDEVFLKQFEAGDAGFLALTEIFSGSRSDRGLQTIVRQLLNFSSIQSDADAWLSRVCDVAYCHTEHLKEIESWDDAVPEKADALRASDPIHTVPHLNALVALTRAVRDAYEGKKQKRAALDFCDVEHAALDILTGKGGDAVREAYRYLFVDEFQDINPLQEAIFRALTEDADGAQTAARFYVGDVKQSIYRFRLSDPEIFVRKRQAVENGGSGAARSVLFPHNFRSEPDILKFCDGVFTDLMTETFGGADYRKEAFLAGSAVRYTEPVVCGLVRAKELSKEEKAEQKRLRQEAQQEPRPVYSVANHEFTQDEELSLAEAEINWITEHILSLEKQTIVKTAGDRREVRRVTFGDIAVLTRSGGTFVNLLIQKLTQAGIPVAHSHESAPQENPAVAALLAVLRVVWNRHNDIALAAVLKSAAGGFCTDAHLAQIRLFGDGFADGGELPFWSVCARYQTYGPDAELRAALAALDARLARYRKLSQVQDFATLCGTVAAECDAFKYALARPDGARVADGLAQFLDSLPGGLTLEDGLSAIDAGAAVLTAPAASDAVKVMTIHASKGLEFPFVILANLEKRYNNADLHQNCILDSDLGAALKYFDTAAGKVHKTSLWYRASQSLKKKQLEEELRILYVALTRGIYQTALFAAVPKGFEPKPCRSACCPLDFLYASMLPLAYEREPAECLAPAARIPAVPVYAQKDADVEGAYRRYTEFVYPYAPEPVKTTVTRLARAHAEEEDAPVYAFDLPAPENGEAVRVGEAYHKFLERYDYEKPFDNNMAQFLNDYPDFARLLSEKKLRRATEQIGARINRRKIYRELPFLFRDGGTFVQGVIDLLITNGDRSEIVDYKTGKISETLLAAYQKQTALYARAVEKLLGLSVQRCLLYSIHEDKFIVLP